MDRYTTTRRHRRGGLASAAVVATSLALVLSACGSGGGSGDGDSTGVTKEKIVLGTTQPLTGIAAPGYSRISVAMERWFDYVNDNGGVNGRKIELIVKDDGYDASKTPELTKQLIESDKVFAMVGALGTAPHSAALDIIRQNRVPDFAVASGSVAWNNTAKAPYTFGWQTDYIREGKILATYVKDKLPGKTYCSFGQADDLGADGVKGVEMILGKGSLKVSPTYTPDPATAKEQLATAVTNLKSAGCDVVFSFSIPGFTAGALATAAAVKFPAQWVVSNVGGDPSALRASLAASKVPDASIVALTNGVITTSYMANATDPANSWVKLFTKVNDEAKDGKDLPYDFTMQYGYALAYTATQALLAAGKDLTREGFVKAIEKGGFEGPGLVPFAYSKDDHSGFTGGQVVQIKDLKFTTLSPLYTTDSGDGAVEEYDEAPAEAPAGGMPE